MRWIEVKYYIILVCILVPLTLFGCSSPVRNSLSTFEEKSWAYEFVIVNNTTYELTGDKVDEDFKGEKIGKVKRNIVDMDVEHNLVEMNFDSNALDIGTKLYLFKEDEDRILFEKHGEFFVAVKRNHN